MKKKVIQDSFKLTREAANFSSLQSDTETSCLLCIFGSHQSSSIPLWKSSIVFHAKLVSPPGAPIISEGIKSKIFLISGFPLKFWTSTKSLQVHLAPKSLPSPFTGSLQSHSDPYLAPYPLPTLFSHTYTSLVQTSVFRSSEFSPVLVYIGQLHQILQVSAGNLYMRVEPVNF